MLTVACVFSPGPTYKRSHIDRLEAMVAQHMRQPYKFVCVDDSPFPGFWAKVSLFEPGRFTGRVLYLDLDVTITGSLDELADTPGSFVICRDWGRFGYNSSVMCWDAGTADHLYTDFTPDVMDRLHGDQNFIEECIPDAAIFPSDWCVSYKFQKRVKMKTLPSDARVIVYHGKPKSWDLPPNHLEEFNVI